MGEEGLEPSSLAAHDFESCAYTNSATRPNEHHSDVVWSVSNSPQSGNMSCDTMPPMTRLLDSIFWVEVEKINPNPYQPRKEFDESKLKELSESIRMYGVLQPLVVTRQEVEHDDGGISTEYELIAGERRLRASKLAGLAQVPVVIRTGEENSQVKLELAIIENIQREDLNPVDRALAFKKLIEEFDLNQSEVAKKVGRSRVFVSNSLRLLALPDEICDAMRDGKITEGHGRSLLMINEKPEEQNTVFKEIMLKKLSVRDTERITRRLATDKIRKNHIDPKIIDLEKRLTESFGTRVEIHKREVGGRVVIDYFSPEDLEAIVARMRHEEALLQQAQHEAVGELKKETTEEDIPMPFEAPNEEGNEDDSSEEKEELVDDRSKEEQEEEDDPDLYAIKNFSL